MDSLPEKTSADSNSSSEIPSSSPNSSSEILNSSPGPPEIPDSSLNLVPEMPRHHSDPPSWFIIPLSTCLAGMPPHPSNAGLQMSSSLLGSLPEIPSTPPGIPSSPLVASRPPSLNSSSGPSSPKTASTPPCSSSSDASSAEAEGLGEASLARNHPLLIPKFPRPPPPFHRPLDTRWLREIFIRHNRLDLYRVIMSFPTYHRARIILDIAGRHIETAAERGVDRAAAYRTWSALIRDTFDLDLLIAIRRMIPSSANEPNPASEARGETSVVST